MNRETLQKLDVKDLQHYRDTLNKRIQQLKKFNIQLGKENVDLAARLNQVRIQAHQLQNKKQVKSNNFDFDDLYRIGKQRVSKIATKSTITGLISSSGKQISKGFGFATRYVKSYISNPKSEEKQEKEEEVNKDADFNSYDIQPPKQFEQKIQKSGQKQYNPPIVEGESPSIRRKNIFNRQKTQQEEGKHSKMEKEQIQKDQKSEQQQQDDEYAIKDDDNDNQENKKSKTPQNDKENIKNIKGEEKSEKSLDLKEQSKISQSKSDKSKKQISVKLNQIVDLENSDGGNSSQQSQQKRRKK